MKKLLVVGALVLAVAPAVAHAGTTTRRGERVEALHVSADPDRATAFGKTFSSFGACVSSVTPLERLNASTASALVPRRARRRELRGDARWQDVRALLRQGREGRARAPRTASPARRRARRRPSRRVVAGRTTAQTLIAAQIAAASSCQSRGVDPGFAAAHGGKTFAQWYGTTRRPRERLRQVRRRDHARAERAAPDADDAGPVGNDHDLAHRL